MIITRLIGGLGNQLFQYAVGRQLAIKNDTVLKVDISSYETYKLRKYSLNAFNIQENFASPEEVTKFTLQSQGFFNRFLSKRLNKSPKPASLHIIEKHFHFDPEILHLPDNVYLDGYWQSEKYFVDISEVIRQECTVKFPQKGKDKELAESIAASEAVSLHVRRADYVANPQTNQIHGICVPEYYTCGIERICQMVKNPHFYVFSDDIEWVRQNLELPVSTTFVDHNGADRNYEDLRLMSQCRHHIIANSTFSWWGAWLNPNPNKIVIAPMSWFNNNKACTDDIIPEGWIKI